MPEYQIIRSRRKTLSLQITPNGQIIIRCPAGMNRQAIDSFVRSKQQWIEKHLKQITCRPPAPPLTPQEQKALFDRAAAIIPPRVAYYARQMGVTYGRITIRSQRTRWGSCSSAGNLNFNCLLVLAPTEVLDYVVVHELCHRKEMNHSPRFWAEVAKVYPGYADAKQWLKAEGFCLMGRLQ